MCITLPVWTHAPAPLLEPLLADVDCRQGTVFMSCCDPALLPPESPSVNSFSRTLHLGDTTPARMVAISFHYRGEPLGKHFFSCDHGQRVNRLNGDKGGDGYGFSILSIQVEPAIGRSAPTITGERGPGPRGERTWTPGGEDLDPGGRGPGPRGERTWTPGGEDLDPGGRGPGPRGERTWTPYIFPALLFTLKCQCGYNLMYESAHFSILDIHHSWLLLSQTHFSSSTLALATKLEGALQKITQAWMFVVFHAILSKLQVKIPGVCMGTTNIMSLMGTVDEHYQMIKKMFSNCEIVLGNLEITFLEHYHDVSFLEDIKEVRGYVLIGLNNIKTIPLTNLQVIRGNILLRNASLSILSNLNRENRTQGLEELPMRQLKEIITGGVRIISNPKLCLRNTIKWEDIAKQDSPECDMEACNGSCWGPGPENCQLLTKLNCAQECPGRCRGPKPSDCCHSQCAAGCTGPKASDCLVCRKFRDGDTCRESCLPPYLYNPNIHQMEPNPEGKYSFGYSCVSKCPYNTLATDLGSCVKTCPSDSYEVEENGARRCKKCNGPCAKDVICDGIGHGKLQSSMSIDATNIDDFENCTIVQGDILILNFAKTGDIFTNTPKLNPEKLKNLKTIREITGYLVIQWWPEIYADLSIFENLEIIRGRTKHSGYVSLAIIGTKITSLGLRSLKEVSDGDVRIQRNENLCFVDSINWKPMFRTNRAEIIKNNSPPEECGRFTFMI
ncbi:PREDICTED: epidermal growth factor receptor-like [Nanorana parkeri]|uniref:epidermal growth factor receptor-like n=1 Tax=Nanorana parkeri TaxID=125878 RepID=UPI0008547AE3|nr:PREDICTED: epidermal growth factor receptor-like [Nanorana parkeri]